MSYECWTHPNGKPDKMVHVLADNRSDAVALAIEKFKSLDIKPIGVTCKKTSPQCSLNGARATRPLRGVFLRAGRPRSIGGNIADAFICRSRQSA
jgi:hypothetical protein